MVSIYKINYIWPELGLKKNAMKITKKKNLKWIPYSFI